MKKNILFAAVFFTGTFLHAQPHVSMYLQDSKGNPIQSNEVEYVILSVHAPDSVREIHFEQFHTFSLHNGLVYLEIGHGTASVDYYTSISRYFNSFSIDERPEAGTNLVVKIQVRLTSGNLIYGYQTLYVNSSDPLIKGNGDQASYLSGNEFFLKNKDQFSHILPGGVKLNAPEADYQMDVTSGIKLTDKKENMTLWGLPGSISIDDEAVRIWNIYSQGFDFIPESGKQINLNKEGMDFYDLNNDFKLSLGYNKFNFTKNNFGWDLTPFGGSFKTNKDKTINFSNNMIEINDSVSNRGNRLLPNGLIHLFDAKNIIGMGVTSLGNPQVTFNRPNGVLSYSAAINEDGGMDLNTYNLNGNVIFRSTTLSGTNGDNPYVYITKDGGAPGAGMLYNSQGIATLFATIKNFRMDHPDSKDQDIVYASLEGPEAAAYCRGTGQLENGKAFIPFPDHYRYVCAPEKSTIQLTPKSSESEGLAVIGVSPDGFQIEELRKGKGNYGFYWEAKSIRKGFENYQVIRPKSDLAPAEWSPISVLKN